MDCIGVASLQCVFCMGHRLDKLVLSESNETYINTSTVTCLSIYNQN